MLVLLRHGYNKPEVGRHQLVLCPFAFWTALTDLLGQLYLLVDGDEGRATYFHKILVQGFA